MSVTMWLERYGRKTTGTRHLCLMREETGGGAICPTITGDHQDRITDYTAIVVRNEYIQENGPPKR
jgi:hypothetical protein